MPLKITVTEDVKVPPVLMAKLLAPDKVRSAPALAITGPLTVNKPPIENGEVFAVRDPVLLTVTVPAVLKPALAVRKPLIVRVPATEKDAVAVCSEPVVAVTVTAPLAVKPAFEFKLPPTVNVPPTVKGEFVVSVPIGIELVMLIVPKAVKGILAVIAALLLIAILKKVVETGVP